MLLFIDFEKAFDTIKWEIYIEGIKNIQFWW